MEKWLPIPNFEHCGDVSNFGRIRSHHGKIRKTVISQNGYVRVGLKKLGAKNTSYVTVHRLVAMCFCYGFSHGMTVNHIDGNKQNNAASNLEWVTLKHNILHAISSGLRKPNYPRPKIPHEDRDKILALRALGKSNQEIGVIYGVSRSAINHFVNGRKHRALRSTAA